MKDEVDFEELQLWYDFDYLFIPSFRYFHDADRNVDPGDSITMDATSIFFLSSFQYLMLAFALSKGPPFRKRIWNNGKP